MGFLQRIWSAITRTIGQVIAKVIRYIWEWVEQKVIEKWDELCYESEAFQRAFAFAKLREGFGLQDNYLRSKLSAAQQSRLATMLEDS
jgi:hypothetical protein